MKLAIYGDSFGYYPTPGAPGACADIIELCWARRLEWIYSVTNYCANGSALFYSMQQFEQTHQQADRVIFIVTGVGRWPSPFLNLGPSNEGYKLCFSSVDQTELAIQKLSSLFRNFFPVADAIERKRRLIALKDWYMWVQDLDFEYAMHALMINRIRELRPDAIIIPICRGLPGLEHLVSAQSYPLRSFRSWQPPSEHLMDFDEYFVKVGRAGIERSDRIVCHMTAEANDLFFQHVLQALDTGQWNPQLPDIIAQPYPRSYYYE